LAEAPHAAEHRDRRLSGALRRHRWPHDGSLSLAPRFCRDHLPLDAAAFGRWPCSARDYARAGVDAPVVTQSARRLNIFAYTLRWAAGCPGIHRAW